MSATKTVGGYFGPKQVTQDEFVAQWTQHFDQFYTLPNTRDALEELDRMKARISAMARERWNNIKG